MLQGLLLREERTASCPAALESGGGRRRASSPPRLPPALNPRPAHPPNRAPRLADAVRQERARLPAGLPHGQGARRAARGKQRFFSWMLAAGTDSGGRRRSVWLSSSVAKQGRRMLLFRLRRCSARCPKRGSTSSRRTSPRCGERDCLQGSGELVLPRGSLAAAGRIGCCLSRSKRLASPCTLHPSCPRLDVGSQLRADLCWRLQGAWSAAARARAQRRHLPGAVPPVRCTGGAPRTSCGRWGSCEHAGGQTHALTEPNASSLHPPPAPAAPSTALSTQSQPTTWGTGCSRTCCCRSCRVGRVGLGAPAGAAAAAAG